MYAIPTDIKEVLQFSERRSRGLFTIMLTPERVPPIKVDFQCNLLGVTCDLTCTEPCSSFQDFHLSPSHTVRIYYHKTDFGISYVFTSCDGAVWSKSDGAWYNFSLLDGSSDTSLLELELNGLLFDYAESEDERELQLLIGGQHYIESAKDPKGHKKLRFGAIYNPPLSCSPPGEKQPNKYLGNHFDNVAMVFLSTIVLFHLLNTRHLHTKHVDKYYEIIYVTMIQCLTGILFQCVHCIAFPRLFYQRIHEFVMDFVTFFFLASAGLVIYFTAVLPYIDWLVLILQQMSFWVCIKICVERKLALLD